MLKSIIKPLIISLIVGGNVTLGQNFSQNISDSTMHTNLEEIVVTAEKEKFPEIKEKGFKTIYYNDANKIAMSKYSGVFSTVPIYSRLRINNMDPKFTTLIYEDIPLILDNTQLHGGISSFNADMTELNIEKTAYSSKYPSIGGIMKINFKETDNNIILSTNILERYAVHNESVILSENENSENTKLTTKTSLRNIGIPSFLERTIKETKIFPNIYEVINNTKIINESTETEGIIRISESKGDFFDENSSVKLKEKSINRMIIARHSEKIDDNTKISVALANEENESKINYAFGDEISNVKTQNSNTSIIGSLKLNSFIIGGRMFFLKNSNLKETRSKKIKELYLEYKHIINNLLIEPSFRISHDNKIVLTSQGINTTLFFKNSSIFLGYNHPTNMLVVDNSSGEKNYELYYLGNQFGDHYVATLKISGKDIKLEEIIDNIEISYYHKYFNAYKENNSPDKGIVKGIDLMIGNNGQINYTIKFSKGDATLNNERMNEAVKEMLTFELGIPVSKSFFINSQYVFNGGYTVRIKADKSKHLIGKAHYISTSATYKFNIGKIEGDVSIMLFNILKFLGYNNVPEFARYKVADTIKSIKMPGLGDIRLTLRF